MDPRENEALVQILSKLEKRIAELEAQVDSLTTLDRNTERRLQEVEKIVHKSTD